MTSCQNPFTGFIAVICIAVIFGNPRFLGWITPQYALFVFLGTIPLLACLDYIINRKQITPLTPLKINRNIIKGAFMRWAGWAFYWSIFTLWIELNPYYSHGLFQNSRFLSVFILSIVCVFGFFYCLAALILKNSVRYNFSDSGLLSILLLKTLKNGKSALLKHRRFRQFYLKFAVKAFYVPLMFTFYLNNIDRIINSSSSFSWSSFFVTALSILFLCDTFLAVSGYILETRFLDNAIKSVEPTFLGWFVALYCYPPFNSSVSTLFPTVQGINLFGETGILMLKAAAFICYSFYLYGTVSFGLRFSNLTNRGIVSNGAYALVRHPAYAGKCTAWVIEAMTSLSFFNAVSLALGIFIYYLRAITEEKHLSQRAGYADYARKVKYRFFPGIL